MQWQSANCHALCEEGVELARDGSTAPRPLRLLGMKQGRSGQVSALRHVAVFVLVLVLVLMLVLVLVVVSCCACLHAYLKLLQPSHERPQLEKCIDVS